MIKKIYIRKTVIENPDYDLVNPELSMKYYAEIFYLIEEKQLFYMCQLGVYIRKCRPYLEQTFYDFYDIFRNYCCMCRGVKDAIC